MGTQWDVGLGAVMDGVGVVGSGACCLAALWAAAGFSTQFWLQRHRVQTPEHTGRAATTRAALGSRPLSGKLPPTRPPAPADRSQAMKFVPHR